MAKKKDKKAKKSKETSEDAADEPAVETAPSATAVVAGSTSSMPKLQMSVTQAAKSASVMVSASKAKVKSQASLAQAPTLAASQTKKPSLMRVKSGALASKQSLLSEDGGSQSSSSGEGTAAPVIPASRQRARDRAAKRAEFLRQRQLDYERRLAEEAPEPVAPVKKKKKKGKGKKGKKGKGKKGKEEKKIDPKQAEEMARQAAKEEAAAAEAERQRILAEFKAGLEKEKTSTSDQLFRAEQLHNSCLTISNINQRALSMAMDEKEENEWQRYISCDGIPNVVDPREMNTYLHMWKQSMDTTTIEEMSERTKEVMHLLEKLDDWLDDPIDATFEDIEHWKWIRGLFRDHQQLSIDTATYLLLRNIDKNLKRINLETATYEHTQECLSLAIWLRVKWPTFYPNPRRPPLPRISVEFIEGSMEAYFPASIDCNCMALRAMHLSYDHVSDMCDNFKNPPRPPEFEKNLFEASMDEWSSQLRYKYDRSPEKERRKREDPEDVEPLADDEIPVVPFQRLVPSASTQFLADEDLRYEEIRSSFVLEMDGDVINLRKYQMLGGLYFLDLFYHPPQPKFVVIFDMLETRLEMPLSLREVPVYIDYEEPYPPDPGEQRTPEAIEKEIKEQEAELDNLIFITITLPSNVMWFDTPIVGHWDPEALLWSNDDIHDLKHIEDKNYITFRTALFGIFGVGTLRYCNLPYQAWEIRPEADGSLTLQITAAILIIDFNVREDGLIAITSMQNTPNNALQDIIGVYHKFPKLMRIMKSAGVNVFPEIDAFGYLENTCEKHWPMEKHLYYNMAQIGPSFNFAWSRWNMTAGRRKVVLQMRQYRADSDKQDNHLMLLATPLKVDYVDCTEVSQTFNETPLDNTKFFADLIHLMRSGMGIETRSKVQNASQTMVKEFADLLIATRVLSFS